MNVGAILQPRNVPEQMTAWADLIRRGFRQQLFESVRRTPGWDVNLKASGRCEIAFAEEWARHGSVIYQLGHSVGAMLAATRAPVLDWSLLPHRAFLIAVPRVFLPLTSLVASPPLLAYVAVAAVEPVGGLVGAIPDVDTSSLWVIGPRAIEEDERWIDNPALNVDLLFEMRLAVRIALNTVAYVTSHRAHAGVVTRPGSIRTSIDVRLPNDVVVDRRFRDHVAALCASRSLAAAKRSLAHVVRGHWRQQAVGAGRAERRLTWVRPHQRGDEDLGRVVQRIHRLEPDESARKATRG